LLLKGICKQWHHHQAPRSAHSGSLQQCQFAGLYKHEPDKDPTSAKSRLGYIIFLANFPLIWKLQLQQEIAISSCKFEYAAASITLRALIPLIWQLHEATKVLQLPPSYQATIQAQLFEDNNAALQLMTQQCLNN